MLVPIVLGTARDGANSAKVADYVLKEAKEYGFETELVKVSDYILAKTARLKQEGNTKAQGWSNIVSRAQALIIVTPEYNHSFPGELKLFLDTLFDEYNRLAVGICGVSIGGLGGARAVEHLKPILTNFKMVPTRAAVYFSEVGELFDDSGNITGNSYKERLTFLFDELKELGGKLRG